MNAPPRLVRDAFAAARDYDRHARVQREVAGALADRLAATDLPGKARVLEIGCGTGFLTEAARAAGLGGRWLATDIAPAMVERCRARLGADPALGFAVLDGERDMPPAPPFDLVCSSLALQWFDDGPAALARMRGWLAPGGRVAVTTLLAGSFAEWRAAHAAEGLEPGTPDFPPAEAFAALAPEALEITRHVETHPDALSFLRALKAIGAGTARSRHRPLAPADLRRVMARFEAGGTAVTYAVGTVILSAAEPAS